MFKVGARTSERHFILFKTNDRRNVRYHYYTDTGIAFKNSGDTYVTPEERKKLQTTVEEYLKRHKL